MKNAAINIVAAVLRAKLPAKVTDEKVWQQAQEFVSNRCSSIGHVMGSTQKYLGRYESSCLYCDHSDSWE